MSVTSQKEADLMMEMPSARFSMVSKRRTSRSCASGLFSKSCDNGLFSKSGANGPFSKSCANGPFNKRLR